MLRGPDDLTFRPATTRDYEAIASIATIAYPWGGEDAPTLAERYRATHPETTRSRGRTKSAERAPRERWVVERQGALVAIYTDLALDFWVGARAGNARGLSGVTVAPEARKSGVARAILAHHVSRARAHGAAWSLCYAYSAAFYERLGWASVGRRMRWRGSPAELPLFPERSLIRRLDRRAPEAAGRLAEAYARHCAETNGSIARPGAPRFPAEPHFVVAVPGEKGALRAYATAAYRATPAQQTLVVSELVAFDAAARRALVGFFAAQRDQADAIELDTPEGDAIGALFTRRPDTRATSEGPEDHRCAGSLYDGLLARVIDLPSALVQRGYRRGPRLRVAIQADDALVPEHAPSFAITIDRGRARTTTPIAREPLLRGRIGAIAQVVTGAIRLRDAIAFDLVRAERMASRSVDALDAALVLPHPAPTLVF